MSQGAPSTRLKPFKPQRFGRYTLLMPISVGGMGEIFLARLEGAHGFDKLCVIKKILPHLAEDAEFTERFVNEARVLVKLSHGNIAQVLDMGLHEGAPYIALEFIDGKDLRRILSRMRDRQLPIPLSFVLFVVTRVLDALAYAHRKVGDDERELNLVHRDMSPQNVLISYEGEVKVIDFGLAKSTLSNTKTNPSIILGKFLYMSPEQARHQKVDRRSDLYAVGLCLYELILGRGPFDGVPPGELMAKVANPDIAPLSSVEPMCPPQLSEAVMKALAPDPAQRWQTAEEFRARLQQILTDLDPAAGSERAARFMRDAFSVEYLAERKMLALLKEQARQLEPSDDEDFSDDENTAVDDEPGQPKASAASSSTSETKTDLSPALMLLSNDAEETVVPGSASPFVAEATDAAPEPLSFEPTALSFEPTKKSSPAVKRSYESDTSPSIPLRLRDTDETLDPVKQRVAQPSIVLEGVEALPNRASDLPKTHPALPAVDVPEPATPAPTTRRASGSRASVNRAAPAKAKSDPRRPATPKPASKASPAVKKKKNTNMLVWVVLPLLALVAVTSYIAWDLYTERLKVLQAQQQQQPATPKKKNKPAPVAPPEAP